MAAMRAFYGETLGFPVERTLGENWIEHRVGSNMLALAHPSVTRAAVHAWTGDADGALAELALADDDLTSSGMFGLLHVARLRREAW